MNAWIPWLLVGVSLLIAEMVLPGAFLMWLGLAAFGTGLLTLAVDLRFEIQVIAFGVLTAISLAVGLRMRRRHVSLNTHQSGLVGRADAGPACQGGQGRGRLGARDGVAHLHEDVAEPASGT